MQRYQRQMLLSEIGDAGQKQIQQAKILLIGAGGLGHPAALYLAAMGVGKFAIVDGDKVHISNLHRQVLFRDSDIGKSKSKILAECLKMTNPEIQVLSYDQFLDKSLAIQLFPAYDVIVDGTDNFESKFLINDVAAYFKKPVIYAAISQFEGQVGVFWNSQGSCYRCLYPSLPKSKIQNCAEAGVIGALPGIIGSMQALETMKVILYQSQQFDSTTAQTFDLLMPLLNKIQYYNFSTNENRTLNVPIRSSCPCHQSQFSLEDISEISNLGCDISTNYENFLDVREQDEWSQYHLKNSLHWPLSKMLANDFPLQSKDKELILICRSGGRAQKAMQLLEQQGFHNLSLAQRGVYEYQN